MTQSLRQELQVSGGLTGSIFPKVDALLEQTDFQLALQHVASRKNMERYRSMVDFLFCEIFKQFQRQCFLYYYEDGPQLSKIVTDEARLRWFEEMLVRSLNLAHQEMSREIPNPRFKKWCYFRAQAVKLMDEAA
ncbi:MAG: hypothetical protein AAB511_02640 [Patescibacteria group bacterium]